MQYCVWRRRYPAGGYDANEGAKYVIMIKFLYKRYFNKFSVDFFMIFDVFYLRKINSTHSGFGN
jgi:hypothetical protein